MTDSDDKGHSKSPLEELQEQIGKMLGGQPLPGSPHAFGVQPRASTPSEPPPGDNDPLRPIREFSFKPRDVFDHLNRFVIGQREAKKVLSVAICDHYNHIRECLEHPELEQQEYHKQNILLLGPTGVGKTYLMRHIAKLIGVPFIKGDATKFSETGYVGGDVEDLVRDLARAADGNAQLAEFGIIYVDEVDKIAAESTGGKDVSGRGVQINLLKLMEETEVSPFGPNDMMAQMRALMGGGGGGKPGADPSRPINTRHILFIVSGAFDKLAENVRRRQQGASIGFNAELQGEGDSLSRYLHLAETSDFTRYGFEPEFIGRLPVRVACDSLSAKDLATILRTSEGSVLKQYRRDFQGHHIDFTITEEAIDAIAAKAHGEGTGARGIMTVMEKLFRDFKYELPSTAIRSFEVTQEMVNEPRTTLQRLIEENLHLQKDVFAADVARFAEEYRREHGFELRFNEAAVVALAERAEHTGKTVRSACADTFSDLVHGLKIISRNTGDTVFDIDEDCARDPDKTLSRWVVESFGKTGPSASESETSGKTPGDETDSD